MAESVLSRRLAISRLDETENALRYEILANQNNLCDH